MERTEQLTFVVINIPSNYDVIVGRPWQSVFGMAVSVGQGTVKFPTKRGITTLQPTQEAFLVDGESSKKNEEDEQGWIINLTYPQQRVSVNTNLTEDTLAYLKILLLHNIDIFAWCPEDITGIPRDIAKHELQIPPDVKPIVQQKRSLAPDRSLAACQEVEGIVQAGILQEIKYHSWIANPVMVRKLDGTWRICIDFKDLKKHAQRIATFAIYQRLVDKVFARKIGKNMEAYVDDLVIKSKTEGQMLDDIQETFRNLRKINMTLNPVKCSFGFEEGKFLGHIVGKQSIKANPKKVKAILDTKSPQSKKEVERLNGKLAALKCFTSKELISDYLSVAEEAISSVLTTKRNKAQVPVYFFSKTLKLAEIKYPPLEKLALALIKTARRLRRYFQAHPIKVVNDQPVKNVLEKPKKFGRLAKWAVELGEHNITYVLRKVVKAQIIFDFILEVPKEATTKVNTINTESSDPDTWKLFTDGASRIDGSGAGLVLINHEGLEFTYALRLEFQTTNNEAEYEALIVGLKPAKEMGVQKL
ncbi:uncharacterized protein LOC110944696 [Helianthus annuus]|uniref:uncharacterized protein LOC110944696 n=1 Tax=Helianthus annuus TaxID=4232 RepID=UPI000B8F2CD4|nr:uncharacterized protein LOC110944696 [Helianthus annuus]